MRTYLQRPLLMVFATSLAGSLLGMQVPLSNPVWAWVCGFGFLALAWWQRKKIIATWALLLAVLCIYGGLGVQARQIPENDISHFGSRRDIVLGGTLQDEPTQSGQGQAWKARLNCGYACYHDQRYAVAGLVAFRMPGPLPDFSPGNFMKIRGRLGGGGGAQNPGEYDFSRAQGTAVNLYGSAQEDAVCLRRSSAMDVRYWIHRLRRRMLENLERFVPAHARGLTWGMVIGERGYLSDWQKARFSATGLAHLLAVSGMNVGILYLLLIGLLRWPRLPRWLPPMAGLAGVAAFTVLTGYEISVLRAALMLAGVVICRIFFRQADSFSGLAAAGLLLLAVNPGWCLEAGAQLSFVATLALLGAMPLWNKCGLKKQVWSKWLLEPLFISSAVLLWTAPLTLYHFHSLTPAAIFSNLLAVPLSGWLMIAGLAVTVAGSFCPLAGMLLGQGCALAAQGLEIIADLSLRLPLGVVNGHTPAVWIILLYYGLLAAALLVQQPRPWLLCLGALVLLLWYEGIHWDPLSQDETRITFLSLNSGEAALVEANDGHTLLIDAGTEKEFFYRVKPFLASRGIRVLDTVILSHSDDDHAGGMAACASFFQIRQFIHAQVFNGKKPAMLHLHGLLQERGIQERSVQQGDQLGLGKTMAMEVIWPPAGRAATGNDFCLAFILHAPGGNSLFPGDCPGWAEQAWGSLRKIQVLKVGHHGDKDASSDALLAQIQPALAVISPGAHNPFGLPDQNTVERLQSWSAQVLDTAQSGAVQVRCRKRQPLRWLLWKEGGFE